MKICAEYPRLVGMQIEFGRVRRKTAKKYHSKNPAGPWNRGGIQEVF